MTTNDEDEEYKFVSCYDCYFLYTYNINQIQKSIITNRFDKFVSENWVSVLVCSSFHFITNTHSTRFETNKLIKNVILYCYLTGLLHCSKIQSS